jgi:hypothetical protein
MVNAHILQNMKKRIHTPLEMFHKMVTEGILGNASQEMWE